MRFAARLRDVVPGAPFGLEALLDEIDTTVLPRRLTYRNAAGSALSLEVCNRRLLSAAVEGPDGTREAGGLTFGGMEDLAGLRRDLEAFCAPGGITRLAPPASLAVTPEETGVAAATLRQAWNKPVAAPGEDPTAGAVTSCRDPAGADRPSAADEAPPCPENLEEMCHALGETAEGWLILDADGRRQRGAGDAIERLEAALAVPIDGPAGACPRAACLLAPRDGPALILLRDGDARAAVSGAFGTGALDLCRSFTRP